MQTVFTSLDGTESVRAEWSRPDRYRDLFAALSAEGASIGRGAGLSYCCASAGDGVRSVSTDAFDRVLRFDEETGEITVEPGVEIGDLFELAVSRGWLPPVLPGHPRITVGGCIGFNVHGKSQHHEGNFIRCLDSLVVFHPDHGEVLCSRETEPDLFELTVGGFGLTGFVTRATLRLVRLPGQSVCRSRIAVANLLEAIEVMESSSDAADCLYSWNDLTRRGAGFGRGVVYSERFEPDPVPGRKTGYARDPASRLPVPLLNRLTVPLMNRAYRWTEILRGNSVLDLETAGFPIHGKEIYYALFGPRGFYEYQMLVPRAAWESTVADVAGLLAGSGIAATLGSLKLFRGRGTLLNFCGTGVCLTLDVPASPGARELFRQLDEVVLRCGGIVNLSKDSRLEADFVRRIFPEYRQFRERLEAWDPGRRFDSSLRRRVLG
jgi:decaprenylphospho-beta-D-ribofuranose 2-oxidase